MPVIERGEWPGELDVAEAPARIHLFELRGPTDVDPWEQGNVKLDGATFDRGR